MLAVFDEQAVDTNAQLGDEIVLGADLQRFEDAEQGDVQVEAA